MVRIRLIAKANEIERSYIATHMPCFNCFSEGGCNSLKVEEEG